METKKRALKSKQRKKLFLYPQKLQNILAKLIMFQNILHGKHPYKSIIRAQRNVQN